MRKIVYTTVEGNIVVVCPSPGKEQKAWDRLPKEAFAPRWIEDAELPKTREFRNAWIDRNNKVQVDMPKARELHRNRLRQVRDKEIRKLDGEWMKAFAKKDTATADAVEAKRQALRDAPQYEAIDAAQTPEELSAAIPEILKGI